MTIARPPRLTDAEVGARVRAARHSRQLSQRALAKMISVSPATLSQIEQGNTRLSVARLEHIASALKLSVGAMLADSTPIDMPATTPAEQPTDWRSYEPLVFDTVLQAALDEFLAYGYHGTTVRGIAARTNLSVSGIYHYYPSKQQMLVAILEHTMADLLHRARAARDEGRDPVERFCALIENLALYHTNRRDLGFVGAAEMRSLESANRKKVAEQRNAQQHMVNHEVEQAIRNGQFQAASAHEAARAVVTMCTALPTWWRPEGRYTPEQVAEQYVRFALKLMT